ncbi:hypothetical protein C5610_06585 [Idiomarina sp. OT37-5b]|jgi:hypothetical protein|uniref:hypothetical protein n=1 Tax=Idiomarina sp. OT37-5b TaxID=2100422 RepID=UPI000CF88A63|nr:hypothetical protein [Idiomarina sp. OT37-5b]AVJ56004.1 hypothetical protein C5610_06585 [Idiomarina sp. OT37-5b]
MPTYRVTYEHIGSKADITVEVPTDAAAGDQRQLEDAIARRVGERVLPHAELAFRHEDNRTLTEKLAKAYDLVIEDYQRL